MLLRTVLSTINWPDLHLDLSAAEGGRHDYFVNIRETPLKLVVNTFEAPLE